MGEEDGMPLVNTGGQGMCRTTSCIEDPEVKIWFSPGEEVVLFLKVGGLGMWRETRSVKVLFPGKKFGLLVINVVGLGSWIKR